MPTAHRLKASLEPWLAQAGTALGAFADQLIDTEFDTAVAWCDGASPPLASIADAAVPIAQLAGGTLSVYEAKTAAEARAEVARIEDELERCFDGDRELLGDRYAKLDTEWAVLRAALSWAAMLRDLAEAPFSDAAAERVQRAELEWSELDDALARWYRARDQLLDNFEDKGAAALREELDTAFNDAVELLRFLGATVGDIDEWVEYERAQARLGELGVSRVIEFCVAQRVAADAVPQIVERACLESWADSVLETEAERLRHHRADQLDPIVDEFRKLDVELIERAGGRVIASCNAQRPRVTVGAPGLIQREAEKQRKHMPVRKLLEEAGEVAQALKPCFMMSPLTVSQFLPPSLRFDAILFDEASQVRPSDAINCVYRGSQLIVAGDDKQLPPTSFFEAVAMDDDDEWEEEQFEEFESILKLCKGSGGLRELPLRWHYRSQHEDLIAYSNESFYKGRLITFPGAVQESDDLGVKFFHVPDGIYRRGTARDNPREAEVVAERVMHWARASMANADREVTLGVVAFSEAQVAAIEVALERRRQEAPELDDFFTEDRLDGFFVKNLENVQGDERDVMIFSVGYGRDENGKLTMNFGPINREGGQRRLNVAITRARQRVEVVSSITGTETEFGGELKEGARHLRRYLDYAARGPVALALEIGDSGLDAESPFEEEVIRVIRSWGYQVMPQVGTAGYRVDIGVKHPTESGRFALGVECDGWMYHSSKVARDRDRLRQEVLERLGWRIHRIWGTAWYRNRQEQEHRLAEAISDAINGVGERPPPQTRLGPFTCENDAGFDAVALDEARPWTVPYKVAKPAAPGRGLEMHLPEARQYLRTMIEEVVRVEGPVLEELVLRRVREAWGVGRAGRRIRESFDAAVLGLVRQGVISRHKQGFLSTNGTAFEFVRVPGRAEDARRDVGEMPAAELRLAVGNLVRDAKRISQDELTFEIARLFGWSRRGPDIAAALDRAVAGLLLQDEIQRDGGYLRGA